MTARTLLLGLMVGATCLAHAQTQQPLPRGPNVVTGRVLDMTSDAPVAGAVVVLNTLEAVREMERTGLRPVPRNVMTAPDGSFVLRDLPAGKYTIAASAFGYLRTDYPSVVVEAIDNRPASVTLRLFKYGSISGRVFDERGEPVVGLPVTALRRQTVGGVLVLRNDSTAAVTDDRGMYRLASLAPGTYVVGVLATSASLPVSVAEAISATAPGSSARFQLQGTLRGGLRPESGDGLRMDDSVFQLAGPAAVVSPSGRLLTYANTMFPGTSSAAEATAITLASGEARGDVSFPIRFVPGVRVSGVVLGPDGPLKHHTVRLTGAGAAETDSLDPIGIASALTDANGRFMFLSVPAGAYVVQSSLIVLANPAQERFGTALAARLTITVDDADVAGLEMAMKPPSRVAGRVEFKPAAGTAPSADERLIIGLRPVAATVWSTAPANVEPDRTFATGVDTPGRYEVYASSQGGWRVTNVTSGGRSAADYVIDAGEREVTDLVITLSNASRRVSGTVADARGAADADALVVVFPADTTLWREGIFQSRRVQRTRTSSGGSFEMDFLSTGDYYLVAVSSRHVLEWNDPAFLERLVPGATRVTLGDGDDKVVSLKTFTPRAK